MKKIFLLALISLQTTILFGQSNWGSWTTTDCFKGIQFRCKVKDYNSSAKQYTWDVEIKNNYSSKVSLNFDIQNSSIDGRTTINAGAVDKTWTLNSSNTGLYITFSKVCFHHPDGFSQCSEYPNKNYAGYADCDNGTPNYVKAGGNNSTQSNNSNTSTQQKTQQSDPTFDRNNASFQDYYKRATAAGQAGNYDEAISLWNLAISVAVNDDQRNNARAWLAEVQKAKGNAVNNNNIQKQQELQRQQQIQKQQQDALKQQQLQEGVTQLTQGVIGLIGSIQEQKERKRLEEIERKRQLKEQEEKEKLELEMKIAAADNGDSKAQYEMAKKYFNEFDFINAENYYLKSVSNDEEFKNGKSTYKTNEISSIYMINGKEKKLWDLINEKKDNFTNIMLILNGENYFTAPIINDSLKQVAINNLIGIEKYNDNVKATIAYYKITGEMEKFGILKNEKEGMEILEKFTEFKKNTFYRTNSLAFYYLGLLNLQGTSEIKKDEDDAFDYFLLSIKKGDYTYKEKEDLIYVPSPKRLSDIGYFNGTILSYIQATKILDRSKRKKDIEIVDYMKRKFAKNYGQLLPYNELEFFNLPKKQSYFEFDSNYDFFDLKTNAPVKLSDLYKESTKPTLVVTWAKDWCNPCLKDIEEIIKLKLDKKYNIVLINVNMKNNGVKPEDILNWTIKEHPNYFNFKMLYDQKNILNQLDNQSAPMYMIYKNNKYVHFEIGYGNVSKLINKYKS